MIKKFFVLLMAMLVCFGLMACSTGTKNRKEVVLMPNTDGNPDTDVASSEIQIEDEIDSYDESDEVEKIVSYDNGYSFADWIEYAVVEECGEEGLWYGEVDRDPISETLSEEETDELKEILSDSSLEVIDINDVPNFTESGIFSIYGFGDDDYNLFEIRFFKDGEIYIYDAITEVMEGSADNAYLVINDTKMTEWCEKTAEKYNLPSAEDSRFSQ